MNSTDDSKSDGTQVPVEVEAVQEPMNTSAKNGAASRLAPERPKQSNGKQSKAKPQQNTDSPVVPARRGKSQRPYPAGTFEDSLAFAKAIYAFGSGTSVRRLSLFDHIGKAPSSGPSRMMVTNAGKYGLTAGGYNADSLDLTSDGLKAVGHDVDARAQRRIQIKLAVLDIEPFAWLYEEYKNKAIPAQQVMRDFLESRGIAKELVGECVDTFIGNVKYLGLLKVLSGAERLITVDHLLDEMPSERQMVSAELGSRLQSGDTGLPAKSNSVDYATTCFYVSPIGEEGSDHRLHSDLFLNHIVAPAVAEFNLIIVRADQIGAGGMITRQIIEHIVRSKLVIADLSYHNPNVFYELAIRHTCRLPTVQIIREGDMIPFDLGQVRTVRIDDSSIYTLVPQLETYKSEIANQVRKALEEGDNAENPISIFFPGLEAKVPG